MVTSGKANPRWLSAVQRWLAVRAYGLFARSLFGATTPPAVMRARFERFAVRSRESIQRRFPRVRFDEYRLGRLAIETVCAVREPRCVLIHLHGGGFLFGSSASYRDRARCLSFRCEAEVFIPDYRLAPAHPFPAALEDALAAYQYVRALRPKLPVLVSGDSAGGGLALSLLTQLRDAGDPMPDGAVLLSPWTDLSASSASLDRNRRVDVWLSRAHLETWGRHYAAGVHLRDPRMSPVFADLHGLPPLLILAGEHEVLLDDALRVADRARRAGTPVDLHVGPGMQHDWPLTLPWLDESRRAWAAIRHFVGARCAASPATASPRTISSSPLEPVS